MTVSPAYIWSSSTVGRSATTLNPDSTTAYLERVVTRTDGALRKRGAQREEGSKSEDRQKRFHGLGWVVLRERVALSERGVLSERFGVSD